MAIRDLDELEAQHVNEESVEESRDLLSAPRPQRLLFPKGGGFPESNRWLERFYAGGRMVREKKPGVFDHLRSVGPYFTSVDEEPLSVLDGMSQTATVPAGFAPDEVVRAYVDGEFGETLVKAYDTSLGDDPYVEAYAATLRELVPTLPHVSFVNSGAESVEKAFALCHGQAKSPERKRVLGFEGSFSGRTLLALHASFNPKKRAPYELAGYEVSFVPGAGWATPNEAEPRSPEGFEALVGEGRLEEVASQFGQTEDALLSTEIQSLLKVHEELLSERYFTVIIEPMQSEGGDRYISARFHRALRLLTRHHDVPLIVDEVQCGFGLGGTFVWHQRFGYVTADGKPDAPDCVTFAKRAQVGIVMSRFADPEPTSAHTASLVRGRLHASMMESGEAACRAQGWVMPRLDAIAARFPELVANPRSCGNAFAFDTPSPAHMLAFLGQRFWRGVVVFGAGSQTIRYRLSSAYREADIDRVFDAIRASLKWLEAHPGEKPPAWQDHQPSPRDEVRAQAEAPIRVRAVGSSSADELMLGVLDLEKRVYEPARRDPEARLRRGFEGPDGVAIVAEVETPEGWKVVGSVVGVPLEFVAEMHGPDRDPRLGLNDTLYSVALTLDPQYRGLGLGRRLKEAQVAAAAELKTESGEPRYLHCVGRNRVGSTDAMMRINESLGAYELLRLSGQYGEADAEAIYYRLPVGPFRITPLKASERQDPSPVVDLATGISQPFAEAPASLLRYQEAGALFGPAVSKITICNYITPAVVRAAEWVGALTPEMPHLYLTSSRDESFDKALRVMRYHRSEAQVALGFEGSYFGHTTAAARSLSDPSVHRQGPAYFDSWGRAPHPCEGVAASVDRLRGLIEEAGGAEKVLGIFIDPVQERTGRVLPDETWAALESLRSDTGVPVVVIETSSAYYRSGRGAFYVSATDFVPDALAWWAGGQQGFVHVLPKWFVDKPLTFVSTWDGDELSMIRAHHQLREARSLDLGGVIAILDRAFETVAGAGGCGLYRTMPGGEPELRRLMELGFRGRAYPNGQLGLAFPLDLSEKAAMRFADALATMSS